MCAGGCVCVCAGIVTNCATKMREQTANLKGRSCLHDNPASQSVDPRHLIFTLLMTHDLCQGH